MSQECSATVRGSWAYVSLSTSFTGILPGQGREHVCLVCGGRQTSRKSSRKREDDGREAEVSAALAARAESRAAGKVRWYDKLPSVGKLAKSAANKVHQTLKIRHGQEIDNRAAAKVWKGTKGVLLAESRQKEVIKADEISKVSPDRKNTRSKLRLQRGQWFSTPNE